LFDVRVVYIEMRDISDLYVIDSGVI